MTPKQAAAKMQESCARAICPVCHGGHEPVKLHDPDNPDHIMFGHSHLVAPDIRVAEYCPATAIRAIKPEEIIGE